MPITTKVVRSNHIHNEVHYLLCDKVFQWLATDWWFSPSTPISSTNKTDSHDITEILLKVSLSIINQTLIYLITVSYIEVIFGKVPLMTLVLFGRNCKSSYIKIIAHLLKCRGDGNTQILHWTNYIVGNNSGLNFDQIQINWKEIIGKTRSCRTLKSPFQF